MSTHFSANSVLFRTSLCLLLVTETLKTSTRLKLYWSNDSASLLIKQNNTPENVSRRPGNNIIMSDYLRFMLNTSSETSVLISNLVGSCWTKPYKCQRVVSRTSDYKRRNQNWQFNFNQNNKKAVRDNDACVPQNGIIKGSLSMQLIFK